MDLVIWGHEHECLIDPQYDHQMGFHVMQPGSTVATSLIAGEAVQKNVAILKITGKEFQSEAIPLKSVRPFITRDIVLQDEPGMKKLAKKENNRTDITLHLQKLVEAMIKEAEDSWAATQDSTDDPPSTQHEMPKPLIRLRVEYSAPEGGRFDCENPQRFSRRFEQRVANVNDVVQFHKKKTAVRKAKDGAEIPEEEILARLTIDSVKVEKLVREYLEMQALTILPQNSFGDAVTQFVDKDDKHAMEAFVEGSLADQVKHLMGTDEADEEDISIALDSYRAQLEDQFAGGGKRKYLNRKLKPKPSNWDDELGEWAEQPGALQLSDDGGSGGEQDVESDTHAPVASSRGRGRGRVGKPSGTTRSTASAKSNTRAQKSSTSRTAMRKKGQADPEDDDDDVVMLDDDDGENAFTTATQLQSARPTKAASQNHNRASSTRKPPPRAAAPKQTTLTFSQPPSQRPTANSRVPFRQEIVSALP